MITITKNDPHYIFSECYIYLDEFVEKYKQSILNAINNQNYNMVLQYFYKNHILNEYSDYNIEVNYRENSITFIITDISTLYNSICDEDENIIEMNRYTVNDKGTLTFTKN